LLNEPDSRTLNPGWQILEEAAQAVLAPEITDETIPFLQIQLLARTTEIIPDQHKDRLMPTLVAACCRAYGEEQAWPVMVTKFFDQQLGKESFGTLLVANDGWKVVDHAQSPIGYYAVNERYRRPLDALDIQVANRVLEPGYNVERGPAGLLLATRG